MDNPLVIGSVLALLGTIAAALIAGIFRAVTQPQRRNGRNGLTPRSAALNPEDAKSGELAAAFWLQQFKLLVDLSNLQSSKMESFGVKLDALRSETQYGFGVTNTLLQDILRELRHTNGRDGRDARREAGL